MFSLLLFYNRFYRTNVVIPVVSTTATACDRGEKRSYNGEYIVTTAAKRSLLRLVAGWVNQVSEKREFKVTTYTRVSELIPTNINDPEINFREISIIINR